jgi:hypothetical protein
MQRGVPHAVMFRAGGGPDTVHSSALGGPLVGQAQADPVRQLPKVLARTDDFRIEIIGLLTLIEANTECMSGVQDRLAASKWLPCRLSICR